MKKINLIFISLISFILIGCGSDGGDTPVSNLTLKGSFIDSPVEGLRYKTKTFEGLTTIDGNFNYKQNETVYFYLNDLLIGSSIGKNLITPIDLTNSSMSLMSTKTKNILVLLQSLDEDSNPDNGISLSDKILEYNLTNLDLENTSEINTLIDNINSDHNLSLTKVDINAATIHFENTMENIQVEYDSYFYDNYYNEYMEICDFNFYIELNDVANNFSGTMIGYEYIEDLWDEEYYEYYSDYVSSNYILNGNYSHSNNQLLLESNTLNHFYRLDLSKTSSGNFVGVYQLYNGSEIKCEGNVVIYRSY